MVSMWKGNCPKSPNFEGEKSYPVFYQHRGVDNFSTKIRQSGCYVAKLEKYLILSTSRNKSKNILFFFVMNSIQRI